MSHEKLHQNTLHSVLVASTKTWDRATALHNTDDKSLIFGEVADLDKNACE